MRLEPHLCGFSYTISEKEHHEYTLYVCLESSFLSHYPWLVLVICFENRTCIRVFFSSALRSFIWRCHSTLLLLLFSYICHDTIHCFAVLFCQTLDGLRSANQRATHLTFDQTPHLTVRQFGFGIQRSAISIYANGMRH